MAAPKLSRTRAAVVNSARDICCYHPNFTAAMLPTVRPASCGRRYPLDMDTIGRYQLVEKLGQGGMGVVYRAFDTLLHRVVAVKLISGSIEAGAEPRERFFREARAAGQLSHRNIITIHDLGEHEGQPYLAMEYLEGEDLQHRLVRADRMSLSRKVELAIEICEGLEYAHARGVVHRDIKPANIFITESGTAKIHRLRRHRPAQHRGRLPRPACDRFPAALHIRVQGRGPGGDRGAARHPVRGRIVLGEQRRDRLQGQCGSAAARQFQPALSDRRRRPGGSHRTAHRNGVGVLSP
jgi:hypothetical protein